MKKIIVLIVVLLIYLYSAVAIDLSDYPDILLKDGKFDGIIVIGDNASADDVIGASEILLSLSKYSPKPAKLSSEITDLYSQNIMIVGNACTNPVAAKLLGNPDSCLPNTPQDHGILRVTEKNGYYQLLVSGSSPLGTRYAANVLAQYEDYDFRGSEIELVRNSQGKFDLKYKLDLSDYPGLLIKNDQPTATLVVGDQSSSVNVLAQAAIAASLASLSNKASVSNKLSSEILDLEQNIISMGNPCINPVTAHIMNNPSPCDKDFENGKAYIKLFESGGFYHIVVAGHSDAGTRKAAEVLAKYNNYNLDGHEYEFVVTEEKTKSYPGKEEKVEVPIDEEDEDFVSREELSEQVQKSLQEKMQSKTENLTSYVETESNQSTKVEIQVEQKTLKEEKNFIRKIVEWLFSLFK